MNNLYIRKIVLLTSPFFLFLLVSTSVFYTIHHVLVINFSRTFYIVIYSLLFTGIAVYYYFYFTKLQFTKEEREEILRQNNETKYNIRMLIREAFKENKENKGKEEKEEKNISNNEDPETFASKIEEKATEIFDEEEMDAEEGGEKRENKEESTEKKKKGKKKKEKKEK